MKKLFSFFLAGALVIAPTVQAEKITLERVYSDPSLAGKAPSKLKLSPDGKRATYIQAREDDYNRFELALEIARHIEQLRRYATA